MQESAQRLPPLQQSRVGNRKPKPISRYFKKPKPTPTSVLKKNEKTENRRKKYRKKETVFADDDLLLSSICIFLPLTLRNEDVKFHYPRYCHCCCVLYSKIVVTVPAVVEIILLYQLSRPTVVIVEKLIATRNIVKYPRYPRRPNCLSTAYFQRI